MNQVQREIEEEYKRLRAEVAKGKNYLKALDDIKKFRKGFDKPEMKQLSLS